MYINMNDCRSTINNILEKDLNMKHVEYFFTNVIIERFMFAIICATLFTSGMCHWLLNLSYRYIPAQVGTLHVEFTWVFWISTLVSIYYLIRELIFNKTSYFDFTLLLIVQIMIFVGVLDYHNELYASVPYTWIIPMAYILGKHAIGRDIDKINNNIIMMYAALAIGMFVITMLDFYAYLRVELFEPLNVETGAWYGFLSKEIQNRCTMGFGLILIISAIGLGWAVIKKKRMFALAIITLNILGQIWALLLSARTEPLLLALSLCTFAIVYKTENNIYLPKKIKKILFISLIIVLIIQLFFWGTLAKNILGIHDWYIESTLGRDGGIIRNVRFSMDWNGFLAMLKYPLDDYELVAGLPTPHSMLLEYGRVYGITTYLGMVAIRLLLIKDAILLWIRKNNYSWIKFLLLPAFICMNIYYAMEPNGHELRYLWMPGLLVSGMIKGWLDSTKMY